MNESRQQHFYSLVHSYACSVQNCACDGVWWSRLNFLSLSWWLSVWDSLLPVVLPSLNVKNASCNGRVCERSQTAIVESLPCWLLVHAGCMLPEKCSLRFTKEIAIATASRSQMAAGTRSVWVFVRNEKQWCQKLLVTSSCSGEQRFVAEVSARWPVLLVVSCGAQGRDTPLHIVERQQA